MEIFRVQNGNQIKTNQICVILFFRPDRSSFQYHFACVLPSVHLLMLNKIKFFIFQKNELEFELSFLNELRKNGRAAFDRKSEQVFKHFSGFHPAQIRLVDVCSFTCRYHRVTQRELDFLMLLKNLYWNIYLAIFHFQEVALCFRKETPLILFH